MERYLKFREEYPRFFYRGYDIEETLNELKIHLPGHFPKMEIQK